MLPIEPEDLGPPGALPGVQETPSNVLLLRGHGRTVLVDAGCGPLVACWPGAIDRLAEVLRAEQAEPDLLIATHLDFDHCGGFVTGTWPDELRPAFPGRRV